MPGLGALGVGGPEVLQPPLQGRTSERTSGDRYSGRSAGSAGAQQEEIWARRFDYHLPQVS